MSDSLLGPRWGAAICCRHQRDPPPSLAYPLPSLCAWGVRDQGRLLAHALAPSRPRYRAACAPPLRRTNAVNKYDQQIEHK
jgi:hypothetical protein